MFGSLLEWALWQQFLSIVCFQHTLLLHLQQFLFEYSLIIWSIIYLLFQDVPTFRTFWSKSIIGAGVYIYFRKIKNQMIL